MTSWSSDDITRIDDDWEPRIAGRRADGSLRRSVIVWTVTVDGDLYTRSVKGPVGVWFHGTRQTHEGHISGGGLDVDVVFEDIDPSDPVNDELDDAYRVKFNDVYPDSVGRITSTIARATTMKILPKVPPPRRDQYNCVRMLSSE